MKGRNCYAAFWSYPGLEKLFNFIEVKSSFLRPVTPSDSQRVPFIQSAVVGDILSLLYGLYAKSPATDFSLAGLIVHSGRFTSMSPMHFLQLVAGHCYFLHTHFPKAWPVLVFVTELQNHLPGRPLPFFLLSALSHSVGYGCRTLTPRSTSVPAILRIYRDIH